MFQTTWRLVMRFVLVALCHVAMFDVALAKRREVPKEDPQPAWSVSYVLMLILVIGTMALLCRPSTRNKRPDDQ